MVERNVLVSVLLVAIIALVAGYAVGQFSAPTELTVTTTSSTTITQTETNTTTSVWTRTTTMTWKITVTETSTTTIVNEPPRILPSPANSTAIIRGHLLFNGTVFVMFSIDKPVYSLGEDIHIKATVTNLTPNNISFSTGTAMIWIENETSQKVWTYPESAIASLFGPAPRTNWVDIRPEETISLDWATMNWNMTGLHRIITQQSNGVSSRAAYNDFLVPEGQYILVWSPNFSFMNIGNEKISDIIPFTITKQD